MAILDVMDVMVCITLIAAMSTFSLEALAAPLPEPNSTDSCSGKRGCNGPNGCNGYNGNIDCYGRNGLNDNYCNS